jgi:hypothetical protein
MPERPPSENLTMGTAFTGPALVTVRRDEYEALHAEVERLREEETAVDLTSDDIALLIEGLGSLRNTNLRTPGDRERIQRLRNILNRRWDTLEGKAHD